jgi:hypothetical protein
MRYPVWFSILCVGLSVPATLGAQQMTQAQAEKMVQGNAMAELTKGINTKKAKVGDPVMAKTLAEATLSDGTKLPKGTRLTGKITAVQPGSKEQPQAQVSFVFDTAEPHKGQTMPVKVLVTAAGVPRVAGLNEGEASNSAPPASGPQRGAAGAPSMPGSASTAGASAAGGPAADGGMAPQDAGSASGTNSGSGSQAAAGSQPGAGRFSMTSDGVLHITGMPVANLSGATLSTSTAGDQAATISEHGKNLSLDSGTEFRIDVMPAK